MRPNEAKSKMVKLDESEEARSPVAVRHSQTGLPV
jgi:hypothetical protein